MGQLKKEDMDSQKNISENDNEDEPACIKSYEDCKECDGKYVNTVLSQGNIELLRNIRFKEKKLKNARRQLNEERAFYEMQKMDLCKTMCKKQSKSQIVQTDQSSIQLMSLVSDLEAQVFKLKDDLERESKRSIRLQEKCSTLKKKNTKLKSKVNCSEENYEKSWKKVSEKLDQYKVDYRNLEQTSGVMKTVYDHVLKKNYHLSRSNFALQAELRRLYRQFESIDPPSCRIRKLTSPSASSTDLWSHGKIKSSKKRKKHLKTPGMRAHSKKCCRTSAVEDSDHNLVVSGSLISIHVKGVKNNLRPVFLVLDEEKSSPSKHLTVSSGLEKRTDEFAGEDIVKEVICITNNENISSKYKTFSSVDLIELNDSLKKIEDEMLSNMKSEGEPEKTFLGSKQGKNHKETKCLKNLFEVETRMCEQESFHGRNRPGSVHIRSRPESAHFSSRPGSVRISSRPGSAHISSRPRSTPRTRPASSQEKSRLESQYRKSHWSCEHRYCHADSEQQRNPLKSERRCTRSDNEHKSNRSRSNCRKIRSDNEHGSMRPRSQLSNNMSESGHKSHDVNSYVRTMSNSDHRSRSRTKQGKIKSETKHKVSSPCTKFRNQPLTEDRNISKKTKKRVSRHKNTQKEIDCLKNSKRSNLVSEDLRKNAINNDLTNLDKLKHLNSHDSNFVIECKTHSSSVQ